jgi:DNA-binding winged helix-turn-helix (wHTH) protein
MAEVERQLRLVRFGDFEVDLRTGELRKAGLKLKFGGRPFQVLSLLLERPGEVVTREELQKRLWPDTFVDVDHNLNTAINKIREVLGDSAEMPRFVETLPRRGYRFIGKLERPVPAVIAVEPGRDWHSRRGWLKIAAAVFALAVVSLGAVTAYLRYRQQRPPEQQVLNVLPFTASPGEETSPAFSPDGSRIAFAWNGDSVPGPKGYDLYVKAIGSETVLRLTQHPAEWISPAW